MHSTRTRIFLQINRREKVGKCRLLRHGKHHLLNSGLNLKCTVLECRFHLGAILRNATRPGAGCLVFSLPLVGNLKCLGPKTSVSSFNKCGNADLVPSLRELNSSNGSKDLET